MIDLGGREIVVEMKFGSHLYGTNTKDSDIDYKGIFMPTLRELVLGTAPKTIRYSSGSDVSKNGKDDIDIDYYSLPYFIKLAMYGETAALDMIHAPDEMITNLPSFSPWLFIRENRHKFYTKNMESVVGYCRKQAGKYGIRGSRVAAIKEAIKVLEKVDRWTKLGDIWGALPVSEFAGFVEVKGENFYEICNRKFGKTINTGYMLKILTKINDEYGHRAHKAANNEGIDWKAMSHALRACFQMIEIYKTGDLRFPLDMADHLREVKLGERDYLTDVAPSLELSVDTVSRLSKGSEYPETADRKFWDDFTYEAVLRANAD